MRKPGALTVVAICFAGSALARIADPEGALAREAQALAAVSPAAEDEPSAACPDPTGLLAALREREAQLAERAEEIADRERLLEVAERKYRSQAEALREAEARLAETLSIADKAAEKDLARMVAVYEAMKPREAARIFETMDATFAAGFLGRMREDAAARILGGMSPERAYAVSAVISGRNAKAPRE
jgi:flagellar motility protein MotE (MotC chaperone)